MRIRGNWISLIGWRSFQHANTGVQASLRRLSSGLRINSSADDASGLAVSNKLLGQFKGLVRANRNALDGVSLIRTAEGALQEVHSMLQRGRQLSLQAANGTLTDSDRQMLQVEVAQLLSEIDRIADSVTFNGLRLLNVKGNNGVLAEVLEGLRSGWLEQSETVIAAQYGLLGDGSPLRIVFENVGPSEAWITGTPGVNGRLDDLTIHVNLAEFETGGDPDGGTGPIYNDRKVARVLTQAVLARNTNYVNLEEWFISGASDYIAGGDEMLNEAVAKYGAAAIVNAIDDPWVDDDLHRASAYLAVKYLDSLLAGAAYTMADVMSILTWDSLDTALSLTLVTYDVATFIADFKANGTSFLSTLDLTDADVGAIGGGDASSVIPNGGTYSEDPLTGFDVLWSGATDAEPLEIFLQIGANAYETVRLLIPQVSTMTLNLLGINLVKRADEAIERFGTAIETMSSIRSYLGSMHNRLEHAIETNGQSSEAQLSGYSRIVDLDIAREMTTLTKQQVLLSSSAAMLAQANTMRQHVMWLLKELSPIEAPTSSMLWNVS